MTSEPRGLALVIDDDPPFRRSMEELVQREGFAFNSAATLEEARARIAEQMPDVVLVDLGLPDGSGLALCRDGSLAPTTEIIVVTGQATVDTAVSALQEGCLDYLVKPVDRARLKSVLNNVRRTRALKEEVGGLRTELRGLGRFGSMVGRSPAMQAVYDLVARVAPTEATVLVTGESGTGKELVAETLHQLSRRAAKRLVAVNCGAIPASLIESQVFGHEKGSFTGAERAHAGFFEQADGGTLFLDEVAEMPADAQVRLLRVLESHEVTRVGGTKAMPVDVRVVAATNRMPLDAVASGALREDLFHRLNVFPIELPALRDRHGDIELLAQHFLETQAGEGPGARRWTTAALDVLRRLTWPGNVRELRNVVQRACILVDGDIGPEALPVPGESIVDTGAVLKVAVGTPLAVVERRLILATLEACGGDKKEAATMLGMSLRTLYNRLHEYESGAGTDAG